MAVNTQKVAQRSIGNCELLEKIGESGVGTVYKARNRGTGEIVAVKVLPSFQADKGQEFQRFARECRILTALNDPRIVRALDFGIDGLNPFLVMEFVEGESLAARLARVGKISEAEAVHLIGEVAGALDRAHSKGLVHRNVKPDKILITAEGEIKLADLSLVRQVDTQQDVTRAGTILGTPNFMAPEQLCNASKATRHCDIYSLAATLYMAVTGAVPFGECNLGEMWTRKLKNELTPATKLVPALSARIDRAIRKAMSTKPEERYATCAEFVEDLTTGAECAADPLPAEPASAQPHPEEVALPVPQGGTSSRAQSDTATVSKQLASDDQNKSDGTDFSLLKWLTITLVMAVGFLSGLSLFLR